MSVVDLYRSLFGRKGTQRGTDIDMSEHGRVGGVSTGQPFKFTGLVDPDTGNTAAITADGKVEVNASVTGGGDGAITDGVSSSIKATVKDYTNSNPLTVVTVDTNGDYVAGAGGTQYTEGDTDASITGTAAMVEGAANAIVPMTQPLTDTQLRASDVKITLDGESVPVTGTFWQATQPVSAASLPLPTGASTEAKQDTGNTSLGTIAGAVSGTEMQVDVITMPTTTVTATQLDIDSLNATDDIVTVTGGAGQTADVKVTLDGESVPVTGTFYQATQPVSAVSLPLPTGAATAANQQTDALTDAELRATPVVVDLGANNDVTVTGSLTSAGNVTNAGTFAVQQTTYSTSSVTSVAGSATSVQLLASTAGRRGAYFYNDSSAICYLKLGTTASTSSFTVAMSANSFYELPYPCYTGRIDAIWASATGNMRITEIT